MISRREMIITTAVATGGLAAGGLGFDSCKKLSKSQLVRWTDNAIVALTEARQVFVDANLPSVVELVDKAISIAKLLKKAFEGSNADSVLTLLAQLLDPNGVIQSIALAVGLLQNEAQRRIVATVLIVTRLALNLIAANVTAAAGASGKARALAAGKAADVAIVERAANDNLIIPVFLMAYGVRP